MNFSKLIWSEPWLAPVILNVQNIIVTESVETAGVTPDGKTLYYNPHFWKRLKKEERLGVQLHEVLHIVNCHAHRRDGRNHGLWNIACDIAINYQIKASGYKLPAGVLWGEDDTAENIYDRLSQMKFKEQSGNRRGIYSGKGGSHGNALQDMDGLGGNVLEGDLLRRNADGSERGSNATMEAIESAVQLAGRGSSPLSKLFRPRVAKADWRSVLQHYVKSAVGEEMDYLSYEFDEFGICEDLFSEKPQPKICVLVDESGSISDTLYEQFLGELSKMSHFAAVYASGFTDNTELDIVPLRKYRRTMTGGTDVTVPYGQACKKEFDCIIILTDGFLEFPAFEPKPTIWVIPQSFGRKMEVIF